MQVLFFLLLLLIRQPAPVTHSEFLFRDPEDRRAVALVVVVDVDDNLLQIEVHAQDPRIQPPRGPRGVAGENGFAAGRFERGHPELVTGLQRTAFFTARLAPFAERVFTPEFQQRSSAPHAVVSEAAAVAVERTLSEIRVGGEVCLVIDWEPGRIHQISQPRGLPGARDGLFAWLESKPVLRRRPATCAGLAAALRPGDRVEVRRAAAEALCYLDAAPAEAVLLRAARGDPDQTVRNYATIALGKLDRDRARKFLLARAGRGQTEQDRRAAISALAERGDAGSLAGLVRLAPRDPRTRRQLDDTLERLRRRLGRKG